MSMGVFNPQIIIIGITMVLHIVWCYVFVNVLGLEYKGVAIATSITYFSNFLLLTVYLSKSSVI